MQAPPPPHGLASLAADLPEGLQILDYWRILMRRRRVLVACVLAVVAVAMLFTVLATPQYRATATVQIQRQGPEILTFKDVLNVDPAGYADFYQTQYKILESRAVLRIAAEKADLANRPEWAARKGSPIGRFRGWVREHSSARPGKSDRDDEERLDAVVDFLSGQLLVQPVRKSYLVKISFIDRDPVLAADVANAVASAYRTFNLDARYSTTRQANDFLTGQVAQLQEEIAAKARKLQDYSTQKEILAARDETQDITSQALAELNSRHVDARGRLALAQARFEAARDNADDALPGVLDNPLIADLKQRTVELEARRQQMAERFQADWPALQQIGRELSAASERLRAETAEVARQIRAKARGDYDRIRSEIAMLGNEVDGQKAEVRRVNFDAIEYSGLKSEIETMRGFLAELVSRQSQTEMSDRLKGTEASNIRIVDAAEVPESPIRPRKALNLLLSLIMGLLLGVVAALVLDHLDYTVKNEQDIQRLSGLPVLGHVPLFRPLRVLAGEKEQSSAQQVPADIGCHADPRSGFAEAFKSLRTSILLATPDRPPRHIVVTSCEPGDGKSTVSVNLAIVLTQLGKRVLLVDADLRRPSVHRMLHLPNRVGLSNFLTGNAPLDQLIQDSPIPEMKIITSGPIPPTPSELLGSSGLELLLDRERLRQFDHVIFDSPPLVSVTDSIILSARTDSTIVVVRAGKTSREALSHGIRRLQHSRGNVTGAVLNAVFEQAGYYYSPYGRSESDESLASGEPGPHTETEPAGRRAGLA